MTSEMIYVSSFQALICSVFPGVTGPLNLVDTSVTFEGSLSKKLVRSFFVAIP